MKISIKLYVVIILIAILLTACGSNLDSPSLVYLVDGTERVNGFQSSYCWDKAIGSSYCVDSIEPFFEVTTSLNQSAPIRFQLDSPLPDEVTISISEELFGDTILSERLAPAEFLEWSPQIAPGAYIIDVQTRWKQGEVSYWFSIVLE